MTIAPTSRKVCVSITRVIQKQQTNRLTFVVPSSMTDDELLEDISEELAEIFHGDDGAEWDSGIKCVGVEEGEEHSFGYSNMYDAKIG